MEENMCSYDEAFTIAEMLEETGLCKKCKLNCPNAGKSESKRTDEIWWYYNDQDIFKE